MQAHISMNPRRMPPSACYLTPTPLSCRTGSSGCRLLESPTPSHDSISLPMTSPSSPLPPFRTLNARNCPVRNAGGRGNQSECNLRRLREPKPLSSATRYGSESTFQPLNAWASQNAAVCLLH